MLSIDTVSTLLGADSTDAVPRQKKHVLRFSVLASWQRNRRELTHGVQIGKRFLQPASGDLQCTSALDRSSLCEPTGRVYTWSWQWLAASVIRGEQGSHGRPVADQVWFLLPCWGPSAVAPAEKGIICDLEIWPMTLTYRFNLDRFKMNRRDKYVGQRSNRSAVTPIMRTHRHTHT